MDTSANRKSSSKTNPIAKDLRTPKYKERTVHPKKYELPEKITLTNYDEYLDDDSLE